MQTSSVLLNNGVTQWRPFRGTLCIFFEIFWRKIFRKKAQHSRKTLSLFLNNSVTYDDVFGELCAFFSKYFFGNIAIALSRNQSISVLTCFFWSTDSSWITFVLAQSCATQHKFPFPSIAPHIDKHQRGSTNGFFFATSWNAPQRAVAHFAILSLRPDCKSRSRLCALDG